MPNISHHNRTRPPYKLIAIAPPRPRPTPPPASLFFSKINAIPIPNNTPPNRFELKEGNVAGTQNADTSALG